jgi:translation initiation factor IF-3
LLVFV